MSEALMQTSKLATLARVGLTAAVLLFTHAAAAQTLYFIHADHLNSPRLLTDQNQAVVWRWDPTEPFGNSVDAGSVGRDGFVVTVPLRYPGQFFDKETYLNYNANRDYDPSIGRYTESDPIGLSGGLNTYAYAVDPLTQIDPLGLMGHGAGKGGLTPIGGYGGWEAQAIFYGVGRTRFTCTDECGKRHKYLYKKTCVGFAVGLNVGAGGVSNSSGKQCRPETYAGWFAEGGATAGPVGVGGDIGFNEDGPSVPGLQTIFGTTRLPGTPSGINEAGVSAGPGGAVKATYCYYVFIGEEK